ncbi:MAG: 3-hydroxybutyryl-CoA dehydrogenase, partial [Bacteroidetes bacterium]|nr:3-hydroxybutyryl-CoA dehydrogenase [Bacteroidota bacterium]
MKNVAIIGSGTMGNGIAHSFSQSGFLVSLIDINQENLDKGILTISKNID